MLQRLTIAPVHSKGLVAIQIGHFIIYYLKRNKTINASRLCKDHGLTYEDWPMLPWLRSGVPAFKEQEDIRGVYIKEEFFSLLIMWIDPSLIPEISRVYSNNGFNVEISNLKEEHDALTETVLNQSEGPIHGLNLINSSLKQLSKRGVVLDDRTDEKKDYSPSRSPKTRPIPATTVKRTKPMKQTALPFSVSPKVRPCELPDQTYTIAQMREYCKRNNITGNYKCKRKADLLDFILREMNGRR